MRRQKLEDKHFIRHKMYDERKSLLKKYAGLTIGTLSYLKLTKYELITTIISPIPGALGLFLRMVLYRRFFSDVGKGVLWGKSITLRHPDKIHFGNRVVIDDYALIDARGSGEKGIFIGDDVIIGRGVIMQAKVGDIHIGTQTNIGAGTVISSQGGIIIGDHVNIAGQCNIAGGAYQVRRDKASIREHGKYTTGPIRIDNKCRLGRAAMVLDGVHIKRGTIIGAMSMVNNDLPEYCVAAGIPARIKYYRTEVSGITGSEKER